MDPLEITVLIVAALVAPAFVLRYILGDWLDAAMRTFFGWLVVLVIGCIYAAVADGKSPDLVTLKKADWSCIHSHTELRLVGKVLVPEQVCDTYQSAAAR